MSPLVPFVFVFVVAVPVVSTIFCRRIKTFTICEIPIDLPPVPFDKAHPVDLQFSSPAIIRQLSKPSTFSATLLGSSSSSHRNAINYCMQLASRNWLSNIPVHVRVNFSNLGDPLILGQGQPSRNWLVNDFICPVALAEAVVDQDLNSNYPGTAKFDILMTLNIAANWYVGLDAAPPTGAYDLVTVCLHEVYHGLFMTGGNIGISLSPLDLTYSAIFVRETVTGRFDSFMANQDGCNITAYKHDPISLGTVLTGNNLWFVSESERIAKLYAPRPYTPGSSLYHLSEADYGAGDPSNNDLMTPAIGSNYAQHNPGTILTTIQQLVLDIENKVGADRCLVVNPPQVDNTPIEQDTPAGADPDRNDLSEHGGFSFTIGGKSVNGWMVIGSAAAAFVTVLAVGCVARGVLSARRRNSLKDRPRRRVQHPMDIANGGNGGGIV